MIIMSIEVNKTLPYVSLHDNRPFGCEPTVQDVIVAGVIDKLGLHLDETISTKASQQHYQLFGNNHVVGHDAMRIDPTMNGVVLTRRRVMSPRGEMLAGVCAMTEDGVDGGSLTLVTIPEDGITSDLELGATEAALEHELLHSIGLGHCAVSGVSCFLHIANTSYIAFRNDLRVLCALNTLSRLSR